jgi:hypothetical protein
LTGDYENGLPEKISKRENSTRSGGDGDFFQISSKGFGKMVKAIYYRLP